MSFINGCQHEQILRSVDEEGAACPGAVRRTVAQHDLSRGHIAAKMETAPLRLAARILGRSSSRGGPGGAAIISGSLTQVTHTNQEGGSSDDRTVVYIQKRSITIKIKNNTHIQTY